MTEEVGRLLALPAASVMQYDGARTATIVGTWSEDGKPRFPVGASLDLDGDTVVAEVLRSGTAQRVDYEDASGALAETVRSFGYRAAVAAPVTVGGRLWGVLAGVTTSDEGLPDGLEQRLCDFAELVAQALANADAYEKLAASRARLVEVGDAERMRLERNLHDGAQQRLVSVSLELSIVAAKFESDPRAARRFSPRPRTSSPAGSRSCASWPAASTRSSSRSGVSAQRSTPCCRGHRSQSTSRSCPKGVSRLPSKRPRTTSSPRRSRTSASTRTHRVRRSASAARTEPQR